MNRRSALSLFAGMPFVGKRMASDLVQGARFSGGDAQDGAEPNPRPYPPGEGISTKPIEPKMPRWQAARAVLGDPEARAQATAFFYERHRVVTYIDPDIEIMRSWSPMAKIAFQRQRNVEHELERMMGEPTDGLIDKLQSMISKMVRG